MMLPGQVLCAQISNKILKGGNHFSNNSKAMADIHSLATIRSKIP
jgi:hypothetical protein